MLDDRLLSRGGVIRSLVKKFERKIVLKSLWQAKVTQIESSNQTSIEKLKYVLMLSKYDNEYKLIKGFRSQPIE